MPSRRASVAQSGAVSCADRMVSCRDRPRCVTGMPAAAGTASALVTPGTTSTGTPAAMHARTSSPPRPSTNGSPPLSRTTRWPACARSTSTALISVCVRVCACGDLPASMTSTDGSSSASSARGASRSTTTTSASASARRPRVVIRPGVARAAADEHDAAGAGTVSTQGQAAGVEQQRDRVAQRGRASRVTAGADRHGDVARACDRRRPRARRGGVVGPDAPQARGLGVGRDRVVDRAVARRGVHQPRAVEVGGQVVALPPA